MKLGTVTVIVALSALLVACTKKDDTVPGVRQLPRDAVIGAPPPTDGPLTQVAKPVAVPISIPGQTGGAWTQTGGDASHHKGNAAYSGALAMVWSANIGQGDSRRNRIGAPPVAAGGRIFTLDSQALVTATGTNGATLWQTDLTPQGDRPGEASGGGLAYGDGRIYVTTGFGELVAIDAASGSIVWRQRFGAPVAGAPALAGGKAYVIARDGSAWAVRTADGRVEWQRAGSAEQVTVAGGATPVVTGNRVIFPFSTGQLLAVAADTGEPVWNGFVAGDRAGRAYTAFTDLTGSPVATGGTIYAGSAAGRLGALDAESGLPRWFADDGATSPAIIVGGSVFFANDEDQLVRLSAGDGAQVWRVDLPYFEANKEKRRKTIYAHHGPILAGGRLILASTDGLIRAMDPVSGVLAASAEIPGGAAAPPIVSDGVLYVVSKNGQLFAFR